MHMISQLALKGLSCGKSSHKMDAKKTERETHGNAILNSEIFIYCVVNKRLFSREEDEVAELSLCFYFSFHFVQCHC